MPLYWLMAVTGWLLLWASFLTWVILGRCAPMLPLTLFDGVRESVDDAPQGAPTVGSSGRL
jgi:hypothetical protein